MTAETPSKGPQGKQAREGCCCGPAGSTPESARKILDRRYASGEITKEQYEEIRRCIDSNSGPSPEEVRP
jgi:hypothetical protein